MADRLHLGSITTDLLPAPLEYAVLVPPDRPGPAAPATSPASGSPPALMYALHGGGGDRTFLSQIRPVIEQAWQTGELRPAVVVTPSADRSFYMDSRDGRARYESAILGPLTDEVVRTWGVATERATTVALGISMGGMGVLRLGLKHPLRFAGVAALEPGIEPVLDFADIALEDRFWRDDALFERIYGSPVDHPYWRANNPASIVADDTARLVRDAPALLLECGDEDTFGLHRGTEYLHRVLYDRGIRHDYHLIRGADHLGRTLPDRFRAAVRFLGRVLDPLPPDPALDGFHRVMTGLRARAGLRARRA